MFPLFSFVFKSGWPPRLEKRTSQTFSRMPNKCCILLAFRSYFNIIQYPHRLWTKTEVSSNFCCSKLKRKLCQQLCEEYCENIGVYVFLEPELQAAQQEVEQLRQEVEKLKKYGENYFLFMCILWAVFKVIKCKRVRRQGIHWIRHQSITHINKHSQSCSCCKTFCSLHFTSTVGLFCG